MKKLSIALCALVLMSAFGFAASPADGIYFAQSKEFGKTGWKGQVVITVSKGKISTVLYNGSNNFGAQDKKTYSAAGLYGMEKNAKQGPWHKQAEKLEAFAVANNGVDKIVVKTDLTTDAVAGATFKVDEFVGLVKDALASKPVTKGKLKKDGYFFAEGASFDEKSGYKETLLITVVNGTIVDITPNAIYKDATKKSKIQESVAGTYGMEKAAKLGPWHKQAENLAAYILKNQGFGNISFTNGKTDAIAGASITTEPYKVLFNKALGL